MNKFAFTPRLLNRSHIVLALNPARRLTVSAVSYGKPFNKEVDKEASLLKDAPAWNEDLATESEADVKADLDPYVDPETLKNETTEWIKSHKDADGNIQKKK